MARRFPQLQPGVAVIIWIMAAIIILNHPDFLSRRLAVNAPRTNPSILVG
jgi:hypothetical protein